jgi:hypothetical protein
MLETGVLVLFLAPGLAAYAAIFGLFSSGGTIAPEPPPANSIKAVLVIGGVALVAHATTSLLFVVNHMLCQKAGSCFFHPPTTWLDPYRAAFAAAGGGGMGGKALTISLVGIFLQSGTVYLAVRSSIKWLARRDRLPSWIYGWVTEIANALDNEDIALIAFVLSNIECNGKFVVYGGIVHRVILKQDGSIALITLIDCDRYLIDLASEIEAGSLTPSLSHFEFMQIESDAIRNVTFEPINLPDEAAFDAQSVEK